ncbi:MAG: hypothetical protein NUV31_00920 [Dehalococcoidales bacterium]|jgi:trk system potassium uptake protein TrkH|nr:hypothetical protein [Dehalococcoidales bacterium]
MQTYNDNRTGVEKLEFRLPGIRPPRIPLLLPRQHTPLSSTLILIYSFIALIIVGMILLVLPISAASGQYTSPVNALFTATSAVCVTGLVVVDTGTYWSTFGQAVLLALFQIGGLAFIAGATILLMIIGGRLGLRDRLLISVMGVDQMGGILGIVSRVAVFSLVIEAIGAVIFYFHWQAEGQPGVSLWTAVFHAVSSFNNCGMDLFGGFKSLQDFRTDWLFLLVTAILIILGSTGYALIVDIGKHRKFNRISLDGRIVLVTSFSLIILGTLIYLFFEDNNPNTLDNLTFSQKLSVAFFQSVTPRTAGFSAIDIGSIKEFTLLFTIFLMFIGGAAGSAAGGVKVNTLGVLILTALNVLKGNENVVVFGRQLTRQTIFRAVTLFLLYLLIAGLITLVLVIIEPLPLRSVLFESFSALGTVGLSTGITPELSIAGKLILVAGMLIGRLGPLTLMAYLVHRRQSVSIEYPYENIRLG